MTRGPLAASMAASLATLATVLMSSTSAFAADIAATSKIDAVTVFPAGAEVTRITQVKLAAGEHAIILNDLPATAIPSSIRVEGKATGNLAIGSVDSRRLGIQRTDVEANAAERKRIEAEIEKFNDEKSLLNAAIEAAETQKRLINNLTELPGKPVPAGQAAPAQPDWGSLVQLIGERTATAQKLILDTQVKIREVDRKITDLQKKLQPLAPAQEQRTEVKVYLTAGAALEGELLVRYQVPNAAWTPLYDVRLSTGTKAVAPKAQLVRRASIQQRTGESWSNVALSLSTTRPASGSQAPELPPMLVDVREPIKPVARSRDGRMADNMMAGAPPPPASAPAPMIAAEAVAKRVEAAPINATIDANAFQAIYGIQGRVTVDTTGEAKRVQIDQSDLEPTLTVRTVPKRGEKAYLYAKLVMPRTSAILPGQVSLFRDATFVGTGRFPQLAGGEEHELGFGQDDNIRVKYAVADEKRSEGGIISSTKTEAKNFRITVKSLHQRPIAVTVIDQQPVSLNQEVKVEFTSKVQPTRKDLEDQRGILAWDFTMQPDEERVLEFGHRISWPAAKQIDVTN